MSDAVPASEIPVEVPTSSSSSFASVHAVDCSSTPIPSATSVPATPTVPTKSQATPLPPPSPSIRQSPRIQHKMSAQVAEAGPSSAGPTSPVRAMRLAQPGFQAPQEPPAPTYLQPDSFFPLNNGAKPSGASARRWEYMAGQADGLLFPEDDPMALRGIPIFRPTMEEFQDFEGYMNKTVPWGMRSGIAKVIPPPEWVNNLPPMDRRTLSEVRIKKPIQQNMMGKAGVFRAQNIERNKTRPLTVRQWFDKCNDPKWATPPVKIVERGSKEAKALNAELMREKKEAAARKKEEWRSKRKPKNVDRQQDVPMTEVPHDSESLDAVPALDHSSSGSTHSSPDPATRTPEADDFDSWYKTTDLNTAWLPISTQLDDFTDEACFAMQERFWKNLGFGEPSWYGADLMQGSLFADEKTPWNVAHLPNLLDRIKCSVPGVNEPYLYFGMWRAAFAWHVEDMDLFSINYIHFGAPKYWYAIPQAQAEIFERRMAEQFAPDAKVCDQFLRHKSYAISPTQLEKWGIRANMLVHKQGEFVVTYPRGYHAGFNMGFNCAESVNFALDSWIELGRRARYCQCVSHSVRIDVDKMLADAADAVAQPEGVFNPKKRGCEDTEDAPVKKVRKRASKRVHIANEDGTVTSHDIGPATVSLPEDTIRIELESAGDSLVSAVAASKKAKGRPRKSKATESATDPASQSTDSPLKVEPAAPRTAPLLISRSKPSLPCLFCPGQDTSDLLQVFDPSPQDIARSKSGSMPLRVHLSCAQAIPEIYIEDIDLGEGKIQQMVTSTFEIDKARWNLKCICCPDKSTASMGVKIQCSKGKCPKAMHVSCAMASDQVSYTLREVDELADDPMPVDAPADAVPTQSYIKTWQPYVLCPQHNPDVIEANKREKAEELRAKVLALIPGQPIKLKLGSSFASTFVRALAHEKLVEVQVIGASGTSYYAWDKVDFRIPDEKVQENEYARVHVTSRRKDVGEGAGSGPSTPLLNFVPTRYDPLERKPASAAISVASGLLADPAPPVANALDASQSGQTSSGRSRNHPGESTHPIQHSQSSQRFERPAQPFITNHQRTSIFCSPHDPHHGLPPHEYGVRPHFQPSHPGRQHEPLPPVMPRPHYDARHTVHPPPHTYGPPPHLYTPPPLSQLLHRHVPTQQHNPVRSHVAPRHSIPSHIDASMPRQQPYAPPTHAPPMHPPTHRAPLPHIHLPPILPTGGQSLPHVRS